MDVCGAKCSNVYALHKLQAEFRTQVTKDGVPFRKRYLYTDTICGY